MSKLTLSKNEKYYTHNENQAFWLEQGSVCLFIVPWNNDMAGQSVRLMDIRAEDRILIPAFAYSDANHQGWRFCLSAMEPDTVLDVRDNATTRVLRKNFLRQADIHTYDQEGGAYGGFENSLIAYYNNHQAQGASVIYRTEKDAPEIRRETFKTIHGGLSNSQSITADGTDLVYRTVSYAAAKCGITTLAREEVVRAAIGDAPMTVPEIARVSHFICREVTLDLDWFRSDCGVIIGQLRVDTDRKDAKGKPVTELHPIVCYPKGSAYRVYDVQSEKTLRLTSHLAAQLEPKAFVIRRPLPQTSVRRKEIMAFVRKSIRARDVFSLVILSVICTLIGVLLPKLNQMIYDDYIPMGSYSLLTQMCLVIASFMMGNVFLSIVKSLQEYRIPCRAGYELQDAVYQRVFELPESFFRDYDSADLAQRLTGLASLANSIISKVFVNSITLAIACIYLIQMSRYSGKLTLAGIAMLSVYGLLVYVLSLRTLRYNREIAAANGQASGKLYQFLSGIDKIRMAGAEERAILEYISPVVKEKKLGIVSNRTSGLVAVLMDAGSTIFSMVLYFMIIRTKVDISMGAFMAFTSAFGAFTGAVMGFVSAGVEYNRLKPSMERIKPVLEAAPENDMDKDVLTELRGEVSVENVTFAYDPNQGPILNNLSIHIMPGEYVAIVGPSGCGKSTLLKLLLGFEKPNAGKITYDGKDIASVDKHSLRKHLGVVLQNGKLISGSIYENVTITSPSPDMKKVWQVIDDVGLREDVNNMPMGLHTVLSESGGTISGGQQQRILIARAIYNDPSVLYFDEATSALDNLTQAKVCASLDKRHMTRVVIAHRLSTVKNCDRIIVMDHGRVVEEGNFDSLMALRGQFYAMAVRQLV